MAEDFLLVLRWWGVLVLFGAAAFPLTRALFGGWSVSNTEHSSANWWDGGYMFSKAVGMAVVGWIVYLLGTLRILPFSLVSITVALWITIGVGAFLLKGNKSHKDHGKKRVILYFFEELLFFGALICWTWIKAHEPSIRGLEKFMDFGFMKSILDSSYFPANDMWFAGHTINYYYFGHIVTAVLTKFSGIDLTITFNLMLSTIFALTLTMSFSIGVQLWGSRRKALFAGGLTTFLVTLSGNMQTLYAFTKGYTGDNVKPFWQLWWTPKDIAVIGQMWEKIGEGLNRYWYANATRFIPFTIHEFPSYSFVVSDIHGHVLSLPFVLLAIALIIVITTKLETRNSKLLFIFYGFLVGVLLMTNALDGPIYLALLVGVLGIQNSKFPPSSELRRAGIIQNFEWWKEKGIVALLVVFAAFITSLPFLIHFKSFVNGIAINCPPAFLANTKIGPLLFEEVTKCQHSPLWMLLVLWGFFLFCGGVFVAKMSFRPKPAPHFDAGSRNSVKKEWIPGQARDDKMVEKILFIFFFFSLALIIFPEFFYFKDIYPMHFRSNTMFKLGYQAFILFSIVAGYTIVNFFFGGTSRSGWIKSQISNSNDQINPKSKFPISRILFFLFLLPQLFLVSIYPIFSVRSYFNGLKKYQGIGGIQWIKDEYPDDWAGIEWINHNVTSDKQPFEKTQDKQVTSKIKDKKSPDLSLITYHLSPAVIVEADGDSYTDYNRFSVFTGIPTVVGWAVHEWLWRGGYDVVAPRREEVAKIYESTDLTETGNIIKKYHIGIIVVGSLERTKYKNLQEWKFTSLGKKVFQSNQTVLYEIGGETGNPINI